MAICDRFPIHNPLYYTAKKLSIKRKKGSFGETAPEAKQKIDRQADFCLVLILRIIQNLDADPDQTGAGVND